ncbi:hypothetical protein C7E12_07935, partial [Stenotrophomonas maltophilia]
WRSTCGGGLNQHYQICTRSDRDIGVPALHWKATWPLPRWRWVFYGYYVGHLAVLAIYVWWGAEPALPDLYPIGP